MRKLGIALAAIAMGAVTVTPAGAAPAGNSIIEITSVASGQCLQTEAAAEHPGLRLGKCSGAPNQRWERIEVGDSGVMLRNVATRQCVDEYYSLASWWCDDEFTTQFGQLVADVPGTVRIKYRELYADSTSGVWPREFADTDDQRWRVRQTGTTTPVDTTGQVVRIEGANNHGCIGVRSGLYLEPKPCADVPEQKFQRIELGNGSTALRSVQTGKCVAARGATGLSGVNVVPACNAADVMQQWTLETGRTGATRIRLSADQRYVTPAGPNIYVSVRETGRAHNTWQSWYLSVA